MNFTNTDCVRYRVYKHVQVETQLLLSMQMINMLYSQVNRQVKYQNLSIKYKIKQELNK
jgi:hypothetical protein